MMIKGLEFTFDNGNISDSREVIYNLPRKKSNRDNIIPLYVKCAHDNLYMDFSYFIKKWTCPKCKHEVDEKNVFQKLAQQNNQWIKAKSQTR